jgi:hypothetical protein
MEAVQAAAELEIFGQPVYHIIKLYQQQKSIKTLWHLTQVQAF